MKYAYAIGIALLALIGGALYINNTMTYESITQEYTQTEATITTTKTNTTTNLSQEEIDSILFMREEEKLARDVYLTLYDMYGLDIFKNIAESEQRHMDAVLTLIEKYGLEDPTTNEIGTFNNPELQQLYDELIEKASNSTIDAILVGALIEEKDIIDINNLIANTTNPEVIEVFQNLVNGSANHLKAFSTQYEYLTGEPYQPQLLTLEEYQNVINMAAHGMKGYHYGINE